MALLIKSFIVNQVDLRKHENLRHFVLRQLGDDPFVTTSEGSRCVEQKRGHVDAVKRLQRSSVQLLAQGIVRLVHARSVNNNHLMRLRGVNRAKTMTGGLCGGGSDGELLAHKRIEQG